MCSRPGRLDDPESAVRPSCFRPSAPPGGQGFGYLRGSRYGGRDRLGDATCGSVRDRAKRAFTSPRRSFSTFSVGGRGGTLRIHLANWDQDRA